MASRDKKIVLCDRWLVRLFFILQVLVFMCIFFIHSLIISSDCEITRDEPDKDKEDTPARKCFTCGVEGHYANACPNKKKSGLSLLFLSHLHVLFCLFMYYILFLMFQYNHCTLIITQF